MATSPEPVAPEPSAAESIGAVAERVGVSERTLRYYEEIGLLRPSLYSPGGRRLYGQAEVDRVLRIRSLQALMGFNLDEIGAVLRSEDMLEQLRTEYRTGVAPDRQRELLLEARRVVEDLSGRVRAKLERLQGFLDELEGRVERYDRSLAELSKGSPAKGRAKPRS